MMLARLVAVDLGARVRCFLAVLPAALVTVVVIGGAMGPAAAAGIFPLTLVVITWAFNTRVAFEDDKADTWTFLRALPIRPFLVVSVRFLSNLVVIAAYAVIVWVIAWFLPLITPRGAAPHPVAAVVGTGLGLSLLTMTLFNVVYFRFGYQAAASGMPFVFVLMCLPAFLVNSPLKLSSLSNFLAHLSSWASHYRWLAAGLAVLTVAGLVLAGWAAAATAFSRREF